MKRITYWLLSTVSAVVLLIGFDASTHGGSPQPPSSFVSGGTTSTVTGSVVNTMWGPVQVQLEVRAGAIKQVKMLQYPHGNSRDLQIDDYALPVLIQETLKDQSAHIDMVSGATYTSTGYIQSLQSAIDQAGL
jgi:uncharacterized protein with FMN-binding domain